MYDERVVVFRVDHLTVGGLAQSLTILYGGPYIAGGDVPKNHLVPPHSAFRPSTAMYLLHLRVWKLR